MKKLYCTLFIFPYLLIAQTKSTTDEEIASFLSRLDPTYQVQIPSDSLILEMQCPQKDEIIIWESADITNDDKEDLLVNLALDRQIHPIIVVNWSLQLDSTTAEVHEFPSDPFQWCNYIQSNQIDETKTVKYSRTRNFEVFDSLGQKNYENKFLQTDLVYKSGAFIEYNPRPSSNGIRSIKFVSLGCFFGCPQYELRITKDGKVSLKPKKYMGKNKRKRVAHLETNEFNSLQNLIQYLDFESLNEKYAVTWTDASTVILEIEFSDGTSKKIEDYGLRGTIGLSHLYSKLFEIIDTRDWQKGS